MSKGLASTQAMLKLLYNEDGIASCPHCGSILNVEEEYLESRYKAAAQLHAFIRHLEQNWPLDHGFTIMGATNKAREYHLRCWLTVFGAEHVIPDVVYDWSNDRQYQMVLAMLERKVAFMKAKGRWGWVMPSEGGLTIKEAASISIFGPNAIGWRAFCDVTKKIYDFAYAETGIDLKEWRNDFEGFWTAT